ncbi:hypothetical protein NJLHNGOC_11040 [Novacetimonas cocois]|uniref:Uncharacterized protein n=2 Tax=Acetobacteraceae TaxID=433 RepID=A0A365YV69_9PROT|nr:hypothetical protein NJLHNGOC_11040 [Novacetimonas cocois]
MIVVMLPYSIISQFVEDDRENVVISRKLFRLLLSGYLRSLPFDEQAYLAANPDVDAAIHRGELDSSEDHFVNVGFFEGRDTGGSEFDEKWYLKNNPDVAASVRRGDWVSGKDHWQMVGRAEFRAPSKAFVAIYDTWRAFLSPDNTKRND